jgi:hypothetical protein
MKISFDSCRIYGLSNNSFLKILKKLFGSTKEPTKNYQFKMIFLIFKTPIKGQNRFFDFWKLLVKNIHIPLFYPLAPSFKKRKLPNIGL